MRVQSKLLMHPIRIHYLSDYKKDEPYELFFRLNQGSSLTPAEKRNTLYGEVRSQVRHLAFLMEELGLNIDRIGFNNNRLSYHDVVSRFLFILENPDFKKKITDNELQMFFRSDTGAGKDTMEVSETAIRRLDSSIKQKVKLNKSTLLTWLCFSSKNPIRYEFIFSVEKLRGTIRNKKTESRLLDFLAYTYYEKSTTSVNDTTPVQIRLLCLYLIAIHEHERLPSTDALHKAEAIYSQLNQSNELSEDVLSDMMQRFDWGYL